MREKIFLNPARKVKKIIGGLWRQRCGTKEWRVHEHQLYVRVNNDDLDSETDLLSGHNPHVHKDQTTSQVEYTESAKHCSASVQLVEAPAVQKDPPTGMAK